MVEAEAPTAAADPREGQPNMNIQTAIKQDFRNFVFLELPSEQCARGFFCCSNGVAISWVCAMLYDPKIVEGASTVNIALKRIKIQLRLLFHPNRSPHHRQPYRTTFRAWRSMASFMGNSVTHSTGSRTSLGIILATGTL